jgi:hypothetical protein
MWLDELMDGPMLKLVLARIATSVSRHCGKERKFLFGACTEHRTRLKIEISSDGELEKLLE